MRSALQDTPATRDWPPKSRPIPLSAWSPGQPQQSRAAIVIGVDKAGDLPKLRAAASGAYKIADWLPGERFDTTLFVDTSGPVQVNDIYRAIASKVNSNTDQLVVYFAGHGFISNYSEFWMLSDAPENPNEAVSLTETKERPATLPIRIRL